MVPVSVILVRIIICFQKKNVNSGRARSNHFRGATSEDLLCYVDARLQEAAYVAAIIHAGVNDILTHLFPMHPFSAPWKHQKTWRFSDVFKGERKGALGTNRLNNQSRNQTTELMCNLRKIAQNVNRML